ncbi:MAG: hydrogenase [Clostridium sp. SCN 57-10]|nr:MAG: hydrogenase [Clostridium sp. SCN 57-10]
MRVLSFTKTALKNLFSKPATRPYPLQPRDYPERTRGHIDIDIDVCVLCGICAKKCPAGAIAVDRAAGNWSIERFGCIQCAACVENCPKKCLSMGRSYTDPAPKKHTDVYQKPPAEANAPEAAAKGDTSHA